MSDNIKIEPRLLLLIGSQKLGKKAEKLLKDAGVPVQYHVFARGTVSDDIKDIMGIGSTDKSLIVSVAPREISGLLLKEMRKKLYLGTPNTGVAFTVPLTGATKRIVSHMEDVAKKSTIEKKGDEMEIKYSMVMAFVNQGFSEEVMSAARQAGAGGGTVFHSRRVGNEDSLHLFGISVQPEREIVMILAPKESKRAIMEAINSSCGTHTPADGTVVSIPVDMVEGLEKD